MLVVWGLVQQGWDWGVWVLREASPMSRGPVPEAYADSDALSRPCLPPKGCGAVINEWCVLRPEGLPKHVPCVVRSRDPNATENGVPAQSEEVS